MACLLHTSSYKSLSILSRGNEQFFISIHIFINNPPAPCARRRRTTSQWTFSGVSLFFISPPHLCLPSSVFPSATCYVCVFLFYASGAHLPLDTCPALHYEIWISSHLPFCLLWRLCVFGHTCPPTGCISALVSSPGDDFSTLSMTYLLEYVHGDCTSPRVRAAVGRLNVCAKILFTSGRTCGR